MDWYLKKSLERNVQDYKKVKELANMKKNIVQCSQTYKRAQPNVHQNIRAQTQCKGYIWEFIFLNSLKIKMTTRYTRSKRSSLWVNLNQLIPCFVHLPFTCKESPNVQVYPVKNCKCLSYTNYSVLFTCTHNRCNGMLWKHTWASVFFSSHFHKAQPCILKRCYLCSQSNRSVFAELLVQTRSSKRSLPLQGSLNNFSAKYCLLVKKKAPKEEYRLKINVITAPPGAQNKN